MTLWQNNRFKVWPNVMKDTKTSRKNVHRLERHPTSSEALANLMAWTIWFFFKFRAPLCKWCLRTLLFGILEQKVPKSVMHVQSYFLVHKTHCFWRSRCRSHRGYFCSLFPCTYCLIDWDNIKSKKMETLVDAVMEIRSCYWTLLTWKGRGL